MQIAPITSPPLHSQPGRDSPEWAAAKAFETQFLAEMLKYTGLGDTHTDMGGGLGEAQISSLMVEKQAERIVDAGGIGIAETVWHALMEKADD